MRDLGNKTVMANNLKAQMARKGVSAKELSTRLNFPYTTVLSWLKGDNYPRIDKIEAMADYFGILKSDLIEEKTEEHREMQKKNDILTDIVLRAQTDDEFSSAIEALYKMDREKLSSLLAFLK